MPNYIIYARKSSESEDRQVLSIESQVKELSEFAHKRSITIEKIYTESRSAKKPDRPVFTEMMKEIWKEGNKAILSWKIDRLARNVVDGGNVIYALEEGKILEILTPFHPYQNNANDKFMMGLEFGMAKKYVDDLSENVKRGLRAKLSQGWMPGVAPLGYLNDGNNPKGQKQLIKDPERFPIIQQLWKLMLTGNYSLDQIVKIANEKYHFRSRTTKNKTGRSLRKSTLYQILINPFYCGFFKYNGEQYQGKHEPMITVEEFERVQELLGRKGRPKGRHKNFTYTGLIRCGECGAMVTAEEKEKLIKNSGEFRYYTYYHCTKRKNPHCTQRCIEIKELESQIEEHLQSLQLPEFLQPWIESYIPALFEREKDQLDQIKSEHQKANQRCIQQLDNLLALKISPENSSGELLSNEEFQLQKQKLLSEKSHLETLLNGPQNKAEEVIRLTKETFNFAFYGLVWFRNGDTVTKKKILSSLGSNQVLINKKLSIQATEPLEKIKEFAEWLKGQNGRLEPKDCGLNAIQNEPSTTLCSALRGVVDDVRTTFTRHLFKVTSPYQ